MKWLLYSLLFCSVVQLHGIFEYDRAVYAAQSNDWQKAQELMMPLIAQGSDNPQLLYDAGVTAYKQEQFKQAQAYFAQAGVLPQAVPHIKEAAFFNEGNAHVKLNQLHEAIKSYETVLALNNAHERARHNLEIVKKMLEQQQQDEKQSQQQEQKNKESDEDKNQQQKSTNESSESDQNNKKNDSEKKDKEEKSSDNNKSDQRENQQEQSDQQQSHKEKNNEREKEHKERDSKQKKNQADEEKVEQKNGKQEHEQSKQHQQEGKKVDQWIAQMLQEQEQQDAQANKKIIKATVGKQAVGSDGYNCW